MKPLVTMNEGNVFYLSPENEGFSIHFSSPEDVQFTRTLVHRLGRQAVVTPAVKEVAHRAERVQMSVDGRTPAPVEGTVVYPIIYRVSYMSGSINSSSGILPYLLEIQVDEVLSFTIIHPLGHVAHQRMTLSGQTNTAVEQWKV